MNDQFGFPRRSEVLGGAGLAGASWKVFWAPPPINATASVSVISPPFPGRYFTAPNGFGLPTAATATIRRDHLTPLIRFTGTLTGGSTSTTLSISLNGGVTLASAAAWIPGAGTSIWGSGLIYMNSPTTLSANAGFVSNDVTPGYSLSTSLLFGGQDLVFVLTNAAAQTFSLVMEYLEIPL